jgi:hypothetical protein
LPSEPWLPVENEMRSSEYAGNNTAGALPDSTGGFDEILPEEQ